MCFLFISISLLQNRFRLRSEVETSPKEIPIELAVAIEGNFGIEYADPRVCDPYDRTSGFLAGRVTFPHHGTTRSRSYDRYRFGRPPRQCKVLEALGPPTTSPRRPVYLVHQPIVFLPGRSG